MEDQHRLKTSTGGRPAQVEGQRQQLIVNPGGYGLGKAVSQTKKPRQTGTDNGARKRCYDGYVSAGSILQRRLCAAMNGWPTRSKAMAPVLRYA
jgi:hypothetical protein